MKSLAKIKINSIFCPPAIHKGRCLPQKNRCICYSIEDCCLSGKRDEKIHFIAKNHSSEAALLSQQLSTETPQEGSRRFLHSCGLARQLGAPSHSHRSVAHRAEQILSLQTSDGRTFLRHPAPQHSTVQCNSSHFQSLFNWLGITESKRTLRVKRNRVPLLLLLTVCHLCCYSSFQIQSRNRQHFTPGTSIKTSCFTLFPALLRADDDITSVQDVFDTTSRSKKTEAKHQTDQ